MSGTDPVERLRAQARASDGPETGAARDDRLDGDAVRAEVARRTAGTRPGAETARRRRLRAGAVGVALVAAGVAAVVLLPGLLPPGDAAAPVAAPSASSAVPTPSESPAADEGATPTVVMAAYVADAREAVDAEAAARAYVLREDETYRIKHPGEAWDSTVDRNITLGDGTATRYVSVKDFDTAVGASSVGHEEIKQVDPEGPKGQMTYWWLSPADGIYTRFPLSPEEYVSTDEQFPVDPVQDQIVARLDELRGTLDAVEALARTPGVTVGAPSTWERDGLTATCITLSGGKPEQDVGFGWAIEDTVDWERRVCFDDATELPVLDERSQHYLLEPGAEASQERNTFEYRWLPLDDASRRLVEPDVDGLTEVDEDTYVARTS
ncbi:hypothetical protein AAG589_17490 [Isoptericola sp. F-RaC21]|uniref:hypothetical protein n=1 Tax=Isoptericola sp. F-RaC21 TaxID=3141452 RepID=UPI00315B979B